MDILSVQQLLLDTPTTSGQSPGSGLQKPRPRLNVQKAVEYYSSSSVVGNPIIGEFRRDAELEGNVFYRRRWRENNTIICVFKISSLSLLLPPPHCMWILSRTTTEKQSSRPLPLPPRVDCTIPAALMCMEIITTHRPVMICWPSGSMEILQVRKKINIQDD